MHEPESSVPGKDPGFGVHSREPLCGGPEVSRLIDAFITPTPAFFVRSHGTAPLIDPTTYRLRVDGLVRRAVDFSLQELTDQFARREQTVTLQCAGNRRTELLEIAPLPGEVAWGGDAIGTARWAGVALADVLLAAGVEPTARHVWFEGLDAVPREGETIPFGASISLDRALQTDVLLAFEMNGEPLPPLHGAPLRVIVPGFIGARSVKWLGSIRMGDRPSDNEFQRRGYKLLLAIPTTGAHAAPDWDALPPIEEMQLNSFICRPVGGATVRTGGVPVEGYATAGGRCRVARVEVRVDHDAWTAATLLDPPAPGAWVRWQAAIRLAGGPHVIEARAEDSDGHRQPEDMAARWNPKGYMNDAWHRVHVRAEGPGSSPDPRWRGRRVALTKGGAPSPASLPGPRTRACPSRGRP